PAPSPPTVSTNLKKRGGEEVEHLGEGESFAPPFPKMFHPISATFLQVG
ncbi:MAG: hypothetical protein HW375_2259, partial [Anaerolineales bacterium]|nr:hypothetical protein [Anaerolineales bacterium]